jgi:hypothetical protein
MNFWINLLKNDLFLAGGDHTYWIASGNFWFNKIFAWQSFEGLGEPNNSIPQFIFFLLLRFGEYLGFEKSLIQFMILLLLMILTGVSFFYYYKELKKFFNYDTKSFYQIDAVIASIFYTLNPFDINIVQLEKLLLNIAIPLFSFLLLKNFRLKKNIYLLIASLLTIVFSPIAINLAVYASIYVFVFINLIFAGILISQVKLSIRIFLIFTISSILFNLWWILPTIYSILLGSEASIKFLQGTNFLNSVGLNDLMRGISIWAWRAEHNSQPYYPYAARYDEGILYFISYLMVLLPLIFGLLKAYFSKNRNIYIYTISVIMISLFLSKGTMPPFSYIYKFIFAYVPFFSIFREPSSKFILDYKIHIVVLFGLFINYFLSFNLKYKNLIPIFFLLLVLLICKPVMSGEIIRTNWNGIMRSWAVKIPDYWYEYSAHFNQISDDKIDSSILVYPAAGYGSAYNWQYGFNGTDISKYFSDSRVLSYSSFSIDDKSIAINNLYPEDLTKPIPNNIWGIFNIKYILQQNDLDWRYSNFKNYTPTNINTYLNNLPFKEIASFGKYDEDYLFKRIPNDEKNYSVKYKLYNELFDKPILNLYQIEDDNFVEKVYIPEFVTKSDGNILESAFLNTDTNKISVLSSNSDYENADALLIKGNIVASFLNKKNDVWSEGWVWPEANVDPRSLEYNIVLLKEYYNLNKPNDPLNYIELNMWYGLKRLVELKKYDLSDSEKAKNANAYLRYMNLAGRSLAEIPLEDRNKNYYELINKWLLFHDNTSNYLGYNVKDISGVSDYESLMEILEVLKKEISFECSNICFKFNVLEEGDYSIYTYRNHIQNLKKDTGDIFISIDNESNLDVNKILETSNREFVEIGKKKFEMGSNYIDIDAEIYENNIVKLENWKNSGNTKSLETYDDIVFYTHSFPNKVLGSNTKFNEKNQLIQFEIKEQYIPEWTSNQIYELSFDYEIDNSVFGVLIAENNLIDDSELSNRYKEVLLDDKSIIFSKNFNYAGNSSFECKYEAKNCIKNFKIDIESGSIASGAVVYLYSYANDNWGSVKIDNFAIRKKRPLDLYLVKNMSNYSNENLKQNQPELFINKINPTLYNVKVENVNSSHLINFSETFSKGWKSYLLKDGKKVYIEEKNHIKSNGYANSWYIDKEALKIDQEYELFIEYHPQQYMNIGVIVSIISILIVILLHFRPIKISRELRTYDFGYRLPKYKLNLMYWYITLPVIAAIFIAFNLFVAEFNINHEFNILIFTAVMCILYKTYRISIKYILYFIILLLSTNMFVAYFEYKIISTFIINLAYILILLVLIELIISVRGNKLKHDK